MAIDKKTKITVLICTLNEAENLTHVLPGIPDWVDEVLIVDGHSTDNTVQMAAKVFPRARVVFQPGKGKGDAIHLGVKEATGDIVITMDADGATDPADLEKFVSPLLDGYDFTKGTRFTQGTRRNRPWYRLLGNKIITLAFNIVFHTKYTDICSGYNAFHRDKFIETVLPWPEDGYENEPFINSRVRKGNLKVKEIAHNDGGRISGDVKERSFRQGFKAIKTILRERFCK
jgi:glycosyltransferase involved in cell wall biosynthesis